MQIYCLSIGKQKETKKDSRKIEGKLLPLKGITSDNSKRSCHKIKKDKNCVYQNKYTDIQNYDILSGETQLYIDLLEFLYLLTCPSPLT